MSIDEFWGIHMPASLGLAPIERGFIAIGWDDMGNLSHLSPDREAYKDQLRRTHHVAEGAIPGAAGVMFRFCVEMKVGDAVIYPSKPNRMVNLGYIDGGYEFVAAREFVHRRPVRWVRALPRTHFSQGALNEIGSAITMFKVTSHADEFAAALRGESLDVEQLDDESADAISAQVEESTEDFVLKRLKMSQTPYQFEQFIAHLLRCMGYHSRVTAQSGDGGIDIIAHRDELGFEPPVIKVQCKQTMATIGRPDIQQLHGAIETGEHGLFVTLGSFSPDAKVFERTKPNLRLIDGAALIELIFSHYEKFEPRYQSIIPLKRTYIPGAVTKG
jgi:restriction system protein